MGKQFILLLSTPGLSALLEMVYLILTPNENGFIDEEATCHCKACVTAANVVVTYIPAFMLAQLFPGSVQNRAKTKILAILCKYHPMCHPNLRWKKTGIQGVLRSVSPARVTP